MLTRLRHEAASVATAEATALKAEALPTGREGAAVFRVGRPLPRLFPMHVARGTADRLLAVAITALGVARLAHEHELPDVGGWALACAGTAALAWRHSAPRVVLLVSAATFASYHVAGYPHPGMPVAMLIAVYTVATSSAAAAAALLSGVAMTAAAGAPLVRNGPSPTDFDDTLLAYLLCIGAACALGYGVQLTRARAELLRQQADRLAYEHAVHETQVLQRQRSDIARDLHDVISHQVTIITALAAGAGRQLESHPQQARTALQSIETAGRDALSEMRRLLRLLRPDGVDTTRLPAPGLAHLPELVAQTRHAGLPVELGITGTPRALPAPVEHCAYRIVQEALTNTVKHARTGTARVVLHYRARGLDLVVTDTGGGDAPAGSGSGLGLIGMKERVALVGGHVEFDRTPEGGAAIHAWLPTDCAAG